MNEEEREAACICANIAELVGFRLNDAAIIALCDLHVGILSSRGSA